MIERYRFTLDESLSHCHPETQILNSYRPFGEAAALVDSFDFGMHPKMLFPASIHVCEPQGTSMVQIVPPFAELALLSAIVLGSMGLGGGLYETLLVDPKWPPNPAIVQPSRGGINRGCFWGPSHTLYELALVAATVLVWSDRRPRWWIVSALIIHLAARAWSFAYFIPKALWFEKLGDLTEDQKRLARAWTRLSRCRPVIQFASILALCGGLDASRAA